MVSIWCNLDWIIQIINTDNNLERFDEYELEIRMN